MKKILFEDLTLISSRQNLRFKEWNRLNSIQGVKKHGKFLVEGLRACLTAIEHNSEIETILLSNDRIGAHIFENISTIPNLNNLGYNELFRISPDLFNSVADAKNPQGIILIVKKTEPKDFAVWLEQKIKSSEQHPLRIALLDQLADPGNVGTIIRTADAFNFSGIILSEGTADPYNPKVMRSTMGSLLALDLLKSESYLELSDLAKQYKLPILISDLGGQHLAEYKRKQNESGFILVIGNEAHGISEQLKQIADKSLTIPMPGKAESLNAAIAFGIMAYHLANTERNY
ncbi:MAG: TrmH family RNA methyltransferase [Saccharofermentanales bacterium]